MSTAIPEGTVTIRETAEKTQVEGTESEYDNWGEYAPEARNMELRRWAIEVHTGDDVIPVGDLSSHWVWYGPSPGSKAANIGIAIGAAWRGKGIGAIAQRLLAEQLHAEGIHRVEASTDVENIPEQRALAKAGFTLEGVIRGAQTRADGRHDIQGWSHLTGD